MSGQILSKTLWNPAKLLISRKARKIYYLEMFVCRIPEPVRHGRTRGVLISVECVCIIIFLMEFRVLSPQDLLTSDVLSVMYDEVGKNKGQQV